MKKRLYLQPVTEVTSIQPILPMATSRGWAKDGNSPIQVEKEEDMEGTSSLWDEDGFLDLD